MPRPARLSLDMMETLLVIQESGGDAAAAAERLGINQPSMSKRLAVLQHSNPLARYPWLEKRGKTWIVTSEGKRVLPAIGDIIRIMRTLQDDLNGRIDRAPDVSLACGQSILQSFVKSTLVKFRQQYPTARLRLVTPRNRDRILGVATGRFDLAIVRLDEAEILNIAKRPLNIEKLFEDPWMLACGRKAPRTLRDRFAAIPEPGSWQHLLGIPLILPEPESNLRHLLDQDLIQTGLQDQLLISMEIGGWRTMIEYIKAGWGIGVVSQATCGSDSSQLLLKQLSLTTQSQPPSIKMISRPESPDWPNSESELLHSLRHLLQEQAM